MCLHLFKGTVMPEKIQMPTIGDILGAVGKDISTESIIDGRARPEVELTLYVEMVNIDDLKLAASKEDFEQWNLPECDKESCRTKSRIRSINGRRWILTTKTKPNTSADGCIEVECDISKDMFDSLRNMGHGGYNKTRYYFPIPGTGLTWEVDVFSGMDGLPHPWVKLDLEVPSLDILLPPWPFPIRDYVVDGDRIDYQQKEIISRLWDEEWVSIDDKDKR